MAIVVGMLFLWRAFRRPWTTLRGGVLLALLGCALAGLASVSQAQSPGTGSTGPTGPTSATGPSGATGVLSPPPAPAHRVPPHGPAVLPGLIWGVGDQHVDLLRDPRWHQLPLRHVRYFVPWDLRYEWRYLRLADQWLRVARRRHAIPLIAITQSDLRGRTHLLPGRTQYRDGVGWILHRYSWVREWTPWNEANLSYQTTLKRPEMAVLYWRVLRQRCRSCTVTSPSIVGYTHNAPRGWMRRFLQAAHGLHGPWAVHLYNDINEFHPYALAQLLRQLPRGPIWVTEAGGWKHFNGFPTNLRRQTRAVEYMFQLAARALPRVGRWYLYQWIGSPPRFRWDSGLTDPNGRARPAMRVVQRNLLPPGVGPIQ